MMNTAPPRYVVDLANGQCLEICATAEGLAVRVVREASDQTKFELPPVKANVLSQVSVAVARAELQAELLALAETSEHHAFEPRGIEFRRAYAREHLTRVHGPRRSGRRAQPRCLRCNAISPDGRCPRCGSNKIR